MAGNYGSSIYRWDMATGELLALYPGYIDGVTSGSTSARMVSFLLTSSPGTLRLRSLRWGAGLSAAGGKFCLGIFYPGW